jgi:hypothetical protein
MDARSAVPMSLLLALAGGCSASNLRPGHCERDSDCLPGQSCVLQGAATFTCAGSDGGVSDGNGSEVAPDVVPDVVAEVAPECVVNADCPSGKPICDLGSCRPCDASRLTDGAACAARDSAKPACGPSGSCVECTSATSADCHTDLTRPICDLPSNTCVKCSTDDQCATKGVGPGICMAHQDGRCAADSEVIYVENKAGCVSSALVSTAGSAATPFCAPQMALSVVTTTRTVIVISATVTGFIWTIPSGSPPLTFIGRSSAVVAGGAMVGIQVSGTGELYGRDLVVRSSELEGVIAQNGATLRLDHVTIDSNRGGGILLDGSAFDIRNSTVTNNGPSADLSWGGIRVQSLPASGLTAIHLVTIQNNKAPGLSCAAAIQGDGVFASGNGTGDIAATCGITACSPAGPTCGAP